MWAAAVIRLRLVPTIRQHMRRGWRTSCACARSRQHRTGCARNIRRTTPAITKCRAGCATSGFRSASTCGLPPMTEAVPSRTDSRLGDGCVTELAVDRVPAVESVRLIDVIWLDRTSRRVAAAFEFEHSTSIHSGHRSDARSRARLAARRRQHAVPRRIRRATCRRGTSASSAGIRAAGRGGIRYLPYGALAQAPSNDGTLRQRVETGAGRFAATVIGLRGKRNSTRLEHDDRHACQSHGRAGQIP